MNHIVVVCRIEIPDPVLQLKFLASEDQALNPKSHIKLNKDMDVSLDLNRANGRGSDRRVVLNSTRQVSEYIKAL